MATTTRSTVEILLALKGQAAIKAGVGQVGYAFDDLKRRAMAIYYIEQQARSAALGVNALNAAALNTGGVGFLRLRTGAEVAGKSAARHIGLARHEMLNLGYQVQDIGVGLASGQSPLLVMAQQGSQIFQVLQGSRGGVIGAMKQLRDVVFSLRGGFIGLGLLAGGGALFAMDKAQEALDVDVKAADALEKANSERVKSLKDYAKNLVQARVMTATEAKKLMEEIDKAVIARSGPQDTTNPQATADRLSAITRRLMNDFSAVTTDPKLVAAQDELTLARVAREAEANGWKYEQQLERLRDQLSEQTLSVEAYTERATDLEKQRFNASQQEIRTQISQVGQRRDLYTLEAAEKVRLDAELQRLIGQRETMERQHQETLLAIQKTGAEAQAKIDKDKLDEQRKILAELERLKTKEAQISTGLVTARLAEIENAPLASDEQKRRTRVDELPHMIKIYCDNAATFQSMAANTEDEAARLQYMERANELLAEQVELQNQLREDTERGSFMGNLKLQAVELANQWQNLNQTMATATLDTVRNSVSGLAGALTSVIMGTQKAGAAFAQFGIQLLTSFVSQIVTAILWATIAIPILTALGILSGGSTVVTGLGVTMAALAAGSAAASGITAREAGGPMIPGLPYILNEARPEIVVPREPMEVHSSVSAYQNDQGSREAGNRGGQGGGMRSVYLVDSPGRAMREMARRGEFDSVVVDAAQRRRTDLGFDD